MVTKRVIRAVNSEKQGRVIPIWISGSEGKPLGGKNNHSSTLPRLTNQR